MMFLVQKKYLLVVFFALCVGSAQSQCPADVLECPGGETLNRDPKNDCQFPSCPCDNIIDCRDCLGEKCAWIPGVNGKEGGCAKSCIMVPIDVPCFSHNLGYDADACPADMCPTDVLECPGGETLNRDPDNGCNFPSCPCETITNCRDCLPAECKWSPEVNGGNGGCAKNCNKFPAGTSCFGGPNPDICPAEMCPTDVLVCPGGETLNRDPSNNCKFPSCPCDSITGCRDCLGEKCAWIPGVNGKEGGCARNCNKVPDGNSCFFHKFGDDADTCPVDTIVWEQAAPTLASPKDGDYFGSNNQLDLTGRRFLVSAKKSSFGAKEGGMVRVYDVDTENGSMRQVGQTLYGNTDGDEVQGVMSVNGDRLAMFTPKRDDNAGRVWIFELQYGKWVNIGKIVRPKDSEERFGDTVAISKDGRIIVVGSTFANNKKGKVSAFRHAGGKVWRKMGSDILGNFADGKFGYNIDFASDASDHTIVVGEKSDDAGDNSGRPGEVRVYRWDSNRGQWRMLGDPIQGQNPGDSFGRDVAISGNGNVVISGARFFGNKDKGGAFGSYYLGGTWISEGGVVGDSAGDNFYHVAMGKSGNRIAVGSGLGLGYVKVFDYGPSISGRGAWTQVGDTLRGEASGENFGTEVSLSYDGETLLVGSPSRDNPNQPGSVRVYKLARKGTYPQYPHISPTSQSAGDQPAGDEYSLYSISDEGTEGTRDVDTTSPGAMMKASFAFSLVIIFTTALL